MWICSKLRFIYSLVTVWLIKSVHINGSPAPWKNKGKVTLGHYPKANDECDYFLYSEFFNRARNATVPNMYDNIVGEICAKHPRNNDTFKYYLDPKELCIRVDNDGNLDIDQFDCVPQDKYRIDGRCECGSRWSLIDTLDPKSRIGINATTHTYRYYQSLGLQKYLVKEVDLVKNDTFNCVADDLGHCNLNEQLDPSLATRCKRGFKCLNRTVYRPYERKPFQNPRTKEWYGICVSESTTEELRNPFGGAPQICVDKLLNIATLIVWFAVIRT